jgi:hypothetical protein
MCMVNIFFQRCVIWNYLDHFCERLSGFKGSSTGTHFRYARTSDSNILLKRLHRRIPFRKGCPDQKNVSPKIALIKCSLSKVASNSVEKRREASSSLYNCSVEKSIIA